VANPFCSSQRNPFYLSYSLFQDQLSHLVGRFALAMTGRLADGSGSAAAISGGGGGVSRRDSTVSRLWPIFSVLPSL
jgi:hypothetical protein